MLRAWDAPKKAVFFKFVTESEWLSIGIVRKKVGCDDSSFPSTMTWTNSIKFPPGRNRETMKEKVGKAVPKGDEGFFLS
jgi:hypothetical protein